MSLKAKIQALINQAEIVKNAWWNIPTDIRVPDSLTQEDFENSPLGGMVWYFAKSIYAKNVTIINGASYFGGSDTLEVINLPNVITLGKQIFWGNKVTKTVILGSLIETQPTSFKQGPTPAKGTIENLYIGKNTTSDMYIQYQRKLTQESLHGIIENLADRTGQTAGMFNAGSNLDKIDEEHIAILNQKNWEYS